MCLNYFFQEADSSEGEERGQQFSDQQRRLRRREGSRLHRRRVGRQEEDRRQEVNIPTSNPFRLFRLHLPKMNFELFSGPIFFPKPV